MKLVELLCGLIALSMLFAWTASTSSATFYPVLVILIIPDAGADTTTEMLNPLQASVQALSYGQADLDFTIVGPYVVDEPYCIKPEGHKAFKRFALDQAHFSGVDLGEYRHFLIVAHTDLHNTLGCGMGSGSYGTYSYTDGEITAGMTLLFCHPTFKSPFGSPELGWVLHEFLHGFGEGTSHTEVLVSQRDGVYVPYAYDDPQEHIPDKHESNDYVRNVGESRMDVMGIALTGLNSIIRAQYGWLDAAHIAVVSSGTSVHELHPIDTEDLVVDKTYMIQIPIPDSTRAYVLEYRAAPPGDESPGVYLYLMPDQENLVSKTQYLLRTDLSTVEDELSAEELLMVPPLEVGVVTSIDAGMGLTARVIHIDGDMALVEVIRRRIYWTDNSFNSVIRADTDGASTETILSTGPGESIPAAIASGGGKIYWGDFLKKTISRADLDGSNVETILTGIYTPSGIAVDVSGGKVYWTNQVAKKIQRANLDGTDVQDVLTGLGGEGPGSGVVDLDIDANEGKLYWTDVSGKQIQRANLDGSDVETIVTQPPGSHPKSIAVDSIRGKVYWVDSTNRGICRSNLDGSDVEDIISLAGEVYIGSIALDIYAGRIYYHYTVYASDPLTSALCGCYMIKRANLDGTNAQTVVAATGEVGDLVIADDAAIPSTLPEDFSYVFFMSLEPGLNMLSLPLKPITPYTARSFAEHISATMVIKYDEALRRFVGFTLDAPDDGFAIEGGVGYIVDVPAGGTVAFTGAAWTNWVLGGNGEKNNDLFWR